MKSLTVITVILYIKTTGYNLNHKLCLTDSNINIFISCCGPKNCRASGHLPLRSPLGGPVNNYGTVWKPFAQNDVDHQMKAHKQKGQ